ncbi:hypothetical protein SprV_0301318500 [Sparganum proliferum]
MPAHHYSPFPSKASLENRPDDRQNSRGLMKGAKVGGDGARFQEALSVPVLFYVGADCVGGEANLADSAEESLSTDLAVAVVQALHEFRSSDHVEGRGGEKDWQ